MNANMNINMNIIVVGIIIFTLIYIKNNKKLISSDKIISGNKHLYAHHLMIIVHPTDELIYGGKLLLSQKNWKVICITAIRSNLCQQFINVMNTIQCEYEIWDHEENPYSIQWNLNIIQNNLKRVISEKCYQMIITHNFCNDINIQHKFISKLLYQIKPLNLYFFCHDNKFINPFSSIIHILINSYYPQQKIHTKYIDHQTHLLIIPRI